MGDSGGVVGVGQVQSSSSGHSGLTQTLSEQTKSPGHSLSDSQYS